MNRSLRALLAALLLLSSPASAQQTFTAYVNGLPAATSSPGPSDLLYVQQGGASKSLSGATLGIWTILAGYSHGVNFNSVADTPINIVLPNGVTNYILDGVWVQNTGTTASLTAAKFGLFTATGGGGTALVAGGTAMSALTSNTVNTPISAATLGGNTSAFNFTTVYFRITTAQGAAASGNVYITIHPLP